MIRKEESIYYNEKSSKDINAEKYVMLWLSNSGVVNLSFQNYNKNVLCGRLGEISVKLIEI